MPNTSPVILILGAGSNIGQHVARAFASKGYKVALAARRLKEDENTADHINITSDLSDPNSVVGVFSKVKTLLGVPSVVVYNAQQAVLGFEILPKSASRTFIYTGNILNTTTMAPLLDLGVGKSATAHIIESAAAAYKDQGFKFYYGDERKADGSAAFGVDGEAHGKLYVELAEGESQGPWQRTFVKGVGYKKF